MTAVHDEKQPFKCEICDKCFSHISNMKRHAKTVHEEKKPFKCEVCKNSFSHIGDVKKHVQSVHEQKKPFKCKSNQQINSPEITCV